jgi:predicted nuclease of predicted toxin-antitoxin system
MVLLLADENIPVPVVSALRQKGYDVLTLHDLAKAGLAVPDDEVLALSTSLERCLITQNRKDFIKLHESQPLHAGILIRTVDNNFQALADRIATCLQLQEGSVEGVLLRVNRPQQ